MIAQPLRYLCFLFVTVIFIVSCKKASPNSTDVIYPPYGQDTTIATVPGQHIFEDLSWQKNFLYSLSDFGDLFKDIHSDFDSAYYQDHVRVFLKINAWVSIPYVAHDHNGLSDHKIYFTDDNYKITLQFPGGPATINAPRLRIYAKPDAAIDFSQKVSVKVIINP